MVREILWLTATARYGIVGQMTKDKTNPTISKALEELREKFFKHFFKHFPISKMEIWEWFEPLLKSKLEEAHKDAYLDGQKMTVKILRDTDSIKED